MKKIFFIALPCLIMIMACHEPGARRPATTGAASSSTDTMSGLSATAGAPDSQEKDTTSLKGEWFLQPVLPSDTATGRRPSIQFNLADHTFSGNTGCNSMRGRFESIDSSLVFDEHITLTKMACPGYDEEAFIKSLLRTNRYRFEDGILVFLFNNEPLSRWTRKNYKAPVKKIV